MTGFVQIGIAAIAALTLITATTIVMQAKERISQRRQEAWLTAQREMIAAAARANRDLARAIANTQDEGADS